ncbi:hypothetical protein E2562_008991 [Oryza meyeriana var. granulata]|uniref:Uncharacterized protein n=1 Tax=Oryza meyeriana var. granulata TaxID=110450 RepID=A0A6G1D0P5_9ORYZ|nr:hypothetical protein E2562_008991 [Oryza meyeriana var. granulata]
MTTSAHAILRLDLTSTGVTGLELGLRPCHLDSPSNHASRPSQSSASAYAIPRRPCAQPLLVPHRAIPRLLDIRAKKSGANPLAMSAPPLARLPLSMDQ